MRIGVITLPLHGNYGGLLQAYALQTTLERMGHSVTIFSKPTKHTIPWWRKPFTYGKRIIQKYIFQNHQVIINAEVVHNKEYPIIYQHTQKFIDTYIHCSYIHQFHQISKSNFDAFIVGSDQVWRPYYFAYHWPMQDAFLDFCKTWKVKRIAYAPSFGTNTWEYDKELTNKCKGLISHFDAISVREKAGATFCKKYFNKESKVVLDPTFLLSISDYDVLIGKENNQCFKLATYILDETPAIKQLIATISQDKELPICEINSRYENKNIKAADKVQPPVDFFLSGIKNSQLVVTDSFHATVFSIIFNRPFIVINNKKRGTDRIKSLLEIFHLENHYVDEEHPYKASYNYSIDGNTYSILDTLKEDSLRFLKEALDK